MIKCTMKYCEQPCVIHTNDELKLNCDKYAFNPVLKSIRNNFGTVWVEDGAYHLIYADFVNIYHSICDDGLSWPKGKMILKGEDGKWDSGLDCATMFKDNNQWFLLYRGHNWNQLPSHQIGLAIKEYEGVEWKKMPSPVMSPLSGEWDGTYTDSGKPTIFDPWGIIKVGDLYYLWFNSDNPQTCRSTGLATSTDLIHWERHSRNPIFQGGKFCVCPFKHGDYYYMVVTAGGYQRKHNWFELHRDKDPTFLPENREYVGKLMECGCCGEFDYTYIDGPSILTDNIQRIIPEGEEIRLYYTGENGNRNWSHGLATFSL